MMNCLDCFYGHRLLTYICSNTYQEEIVCLREYESDDVPQTLYQCSCVQPELCNYFEDRRLV